jgi:dihydroorotate dehydrogenase (fumarate)
VSKDGWRDYARQMQDAGADAIELNAYFVPTDPDLDAKAVEDRYIEAVAAAAGAVKIPVAMKLAPYFTALVHFARRLVAAGAKGLTLFQRPVAPDLDLDELHVRLDPHLSTSVDVGLPLRWLAILHGRVGCDLAASTGAHKAADVVKLLLAGACSTQMTSALIENGPEHVTSVLKGLELWLEEHEDPRVAEVEGSLSQLHCEEPDEYEHAQHHKRLIRYTHE